MFFVKTRFNISGCNKPIGCFVLNMNVYFLTDTRLHIRLIKSRECQNNIACKHYIQHNCQSFLPVHAHHTYKTNILVTAYSYSLRFVLPVEHSYLNRQHQEIQVHQNLFSLLIREHLPCVSCFFLRHLSTDHKSIYSLLPQ